MTNAQQSPLPAVPKMVGQALKAWEAPLPVTLPSDGDHWIDLPASSDQVFKTWARIEGMQPKGIGRPKDFATGLKMFTRDISQTKWGDAEFVYLDSFMRVPVEADVHTHIVVDQVRLVLSYYTTPIIRFAFSFYPAILSTKPEGLHKDGSSLFRDKSRRSLTRMREVLSSSDELNLLQSKRRAEEVASAARDVLVRAQGLGIDALDSDLRSVAKMLVTKGSIRLVSAIEEYVHLIDSDDPPRVKGQTAAELEHTLLLLREWLEGNSLDLIPAGPALDTLIKELRRRLDVLSFKVPSMYACSCGLNQFINSRAARTSLDALAKRDAAGEEEARAEIYAATGVEGRVHNDVAERVFKKSLERAAKTAARDAWEEGKASEGVTDEELIRRFWGSYFGAIKRENSSPAVSLDTENEAGGTVGDHSETSRPQRDAATDGDLGLWIYHRFEGPLVNRMDADKVLAGVRSLLKGESEPDDSKPEQCERADELFEILLNAGGFDEEKSFELDRAIAEANTFDTVVDVFLRTDGFIDSIERAYEDGIPDRAINSEPAGAITMIFTLLYRAFDAYGYRFEKARSSDGRMAFDMLRP